jgi:hypothetical protein
MAVVQGIECEVTFLAHRIVAAPISYDGMSELMYAHRKNPEHRDDDENFHAKKRLPGKAIQQKPFVPVRSLR